MPTGPDHAIRDEEGKCWRKKGLPDARSRRAHNKKEKREHPLYTRLTLTYARRFELLIERLGHRNNADLIEEAVDLLEKLEQAAVDLNYERRSDLLQDACDSIKFIMKRGPLPACARLDEQPLALPAPRADQSNL